MLFPSTDKITELAFYLLRPVLQKLKSQNLPPLERPLVLRAADCSKLREAGMGWWTIIISQSPCDDGSKGFIKIFSYERDGNFFFYLVIYVDECLYENNTNALRARRKMIAIHELVHGFAYMHMSTTLDSSIFVEIMKHKVNMKLHMLSLPDFNSILEAIGKPDNINQSFSSGHFRLAGDSFQGSYSELLINLMLSYDLAVETIKIIKNDYVRAGKEISISELIPLAISRLVDRKALFENFVRTRMDAFAPMLYTDFL